MLLKCKNTFIEKSDFISEKTLVSEDIFFRIKADRYNLQGLIEEVRENYKEQFSPDCIPMICKRKSKYKFSLNRDFYEEFEWDRLLTMEDINKYFIEAKGATICIYFANTDVMGDIKLADGNEKLNERSKIGEMNFYEDTAFAMTVELIDGEYIFNQAQYTAGADNCPASLYILNDAGELSNRMMALIDKYNLS